MNATRSANGWQDAWQDARQDASPHDLGLDAGLFEDDSQPAQACDDVGAAGGPDAGDRQAADGARPVGPAHAGHPAHPIHSALAGPVDEAQLAAWIEAIAVHDEHALTALYDATVARVYGLVLRMLRRPALAEEVVEDTYFQVWRQAPRFDPARGRAMAWLLIMARSRAIDAIRREARFQHDSLDCGAVTQLCDPQPAVDELLEAARSHADLHRALLLLEARPRQLVAMAFLGGLSHEEIASQTALPLGTVKSQIRRALLSLRQVLGEPGLAALPT